MDGSNKSTTEVKQNCIPIPVENELKNSYLTYAMSVIVSRALPDVRDGLKPSQRRVMVAMNDLNLGPKSKYRKCAKISGDTSGNYHPHGEAVIYPTLVRMAQPFNLRYPLIDGQGNFGSLDGDPPAAMRYTEARMTAMSMEMLEDLDKDTVDFTSNYDETREEPLVLPSKFPNLLVNGSVGIAVGMATSIPPNNLGEICDAIIAVIDNPDITVREVCMIVPGPDFPTGGNICGRSAAMHAYSSGRGTIKVRASYTIEEKQGKSRIIFTDIPFQLNKARIIESMADLVKSGKILGISDIRDESDREHDVRIVVEVKKNENAEVILNQLYKYTALQSSASVILIALVDGQPRLLNIKQMIQCFIKHRQNIVRRRTNFLLKKAEARAHIIEGLRIAITYIDDVITLLRRAVDNKTARENLMRTYNLSALQTDAILQMRLSSLTGLESNKLKEELESLESKIKEYNDILENESRILEIIKEETKELKTKYSTERKTHIITDIEDISTEDIIPNIPWLVMMTNNGYIKRMSLESYRIQNRGGVGISGGEMKDDDFPIELITASAHQNLLFFSSLGRVYCRKAYEIPEASRTSRGRALVNIFDLQPEETIRTIISISSFENQFLVLLTENGFIKKVELSELSHIKKNGIRIITLEEHDRLISVCITNGNMNLILATAQGRVCNFSEAEIRPTGRTSRGVMACTLKNDDKVVNMVAIEDKEDTLLSITKNGYAKRTKCSCFRQTKRKSMGVGNLRKIDITGPVVSTITVQNDNEEVMIITAQGMIIRTHAALRCINRLTKGIKFLRLKENDYVVTIMKLSCDVVEFLQNAQEFTENQDTIIEDSQENSEDAQEDSQDNAEDAQEDAQENVEEQSEDEELLDVPKDEFLNASDIVEDEQDNEAESNYNESMQEDEEHNEDDI